MRPDPRIRKISRGVNTDRTLYTLPKRSSVWRLGRGLAARLLSSSLQTNRWRAFFASWLHVVGNAVTTVCMAFTVDARHIFFTFGDKAIVLAFALQKQGVPIKESIDET